MQVAGRAEAISSGGGVPNLSGRQIAAICAGNALEFYDFVVYAIFAAQIGRTFFPSERPGVSLLASLATFGVGFATRPLGALVIGRFADRAGRRPAMIVSFSLIGLSVGGLALTPGYASIGMAAPLLAVLFRLLQGFALGGEVGPSTALLLESAPVRRRGLMVSLQAMSADGAVMIAGSRPPRSMPGDGGWRCFSASRSCRSRSRRDERLSRRWSSRRRCRQAPGRRPRAASSCSAS